MIISTKFAIKTCIWFEIWSLDWVRFEFQTQFHLEFHVWNSNFESISIEILLKFDDITLNFNMIFFKFAIVFKLAILTIWQNFFFIIPCKKLSRFFLEWIRSFKKSQQLDCGFIDDFVWPFCSIRFNFINLFDILQFADFKNRKKKDSREKC